MAYAFKRTEEALQGALSRGAPQSTPTQSNLQGEAPKQSGPKSNAATILERNQGGVGGQAAKSRVQNVIGSELNSSQARDSEALGSAKVSSDLDKDINWGESSGTDEGMNKALSQWDATVQTQAPKITHQSSGLKKTAELGQNLSSALSQGRQRYSAGMGALDTASLGTDASGLQAEAAQKAREYNDYFNQQKGVVEDRLEQQTQKGIDDWLNRNQVGIEGQQQRLKNQLDSQANAANQYQQSRLAAGNTVQAEAEKIAKDYENWRQGQIVKALQDEFGQNWYHNPAATQAGQGLTDLAKFQAPEQVAFQSTPYKGSDFYSTVAPQYERLVAALAKSRPGQKVDTLTDTLNEAEQEKKLQEYLGAQGKRLSGMQSDIEAKKALFEANKRAAMYPQASGPNWLAERLAEQHTNPIATAQKDSESALDKLAGWFGL